MGNPYEARPNVFDAGDTATTPSAPEPTLAPTSEETPDNPTQLVVPTGSIKEVLEWVGGDKDKARAALEVEKADDKPRRGLLNELNEIIG